jgi:hypothetical protein
MSKKSKTTLHKEIELPQYPNQLKITGMAALISFIGGLFYPIIFAGTAAFLVIAVGIITYNAKFKAVYYSRRAISKYNSEKYKECFKLCKKALKYDNNLSSTHDLMSLSIKRGKLKF